MTTPTNQIALLQARVAGDPMLEHEHQCFAQRAHLPYKAFKPINMTCQDLSLEALEGCQAVRIGGSGDFSVVVGGFDWHEPMLALLRQIAQRRMPCFASCFGHQALIQALGGELRRDPEHSEVGTYELTLNEDGQADPLFGILPQVFNAHFGHLDRVTVLPDAFTNMASSQLCAVQATRLGDAPIVTAQFHPELSYLDNLERWLNYLRNYSDPDTPVEEAEADARRRCFPGPESTTLIKRFVDLYI